MCKLHCMEVGESGRQTPLTPLISEHNGSRQKTSKRFLQPEALGLQLFIVHRQMWNGGADKL